MARSEDAIPYERNSFRRRAVKVEEEPFGSLSNSAAGRRCHFVLLADHRRRAGNPRRGSLPGV